MEDIYANIYVLKCYRESEKVRIVMPVVEVVNEWRFSFSFVRSHYLVRHAKLGKMLCDIVLLRRLLRHARRLRIKKLFRRAEKIEALKDLPLVG